MKLIYEFWSIRYLVCEKVAYNEVKTLIWNNTKYSHKPHVGKYQHTIIHTRTRMPTPTNTDNINKTITQPG